MLKISPNRWRIEPPLHQSFYYRLWPCHYHITTWFMGLATDRREAVSADLSRLSLSTTDSDRAITTSPRDLWAAWRPTDARLKSPLTSFISFYPIYFLAPPHTPCWLGADSGANWKTNGTGNPLSFDIRRGAKNESSQVCRYLLPVTYLI